MQVTAFKESGLICRNGVFALSTRILGSRVLVTYNIRNRKEAVGRSTYLAIPLLQHLVNKQINASTDWNRTELSNDSWTRTLEEYNGSGENKPRRKPRLFIGCRSTTAVNNTSHVYGLSPYPTYPQSMLFPHIKRDVIHRLWHAIRIPPNIPVA